MQAEKFDPMKDALAARRGKGLEIVIGLGHDAPSREGGSSGPHHGEGKQVQVGEDDNATGRSDLAPPPVSESDGASPMNSARDLHAPHPEGVIASQHAMNPGDVPTPDDARAHFSQNMSENDIRDLANRNPRSLAERARKEALNTMKSKPSTKGMDGFSKRDSDFSP